VARAARFVANDGVHSWCVGMQNLSLSREEALERCQHGGTVLCLDVPQGVEFGIDLRSYTVGPRFRGVKMVPPHGVHMITCGNEIEQTGVFVSLRPSETCAMSWDAPTETLKLLDDAAMREQLTHAVQRMELDAFLGPYPLATEGQWHELSDLVTEDVLRRAGVPAGTFIMPGGIDDDDEGDDIQAQQHLQPYFDGTARVAHFVQLDPRKQRTQRGHGRTGAALSQFHIDRSEWLRELLACDYGSESTGGCRGSSDGGGGGGEKGDGTHVAGSAAAAAAAEAALLGELQLAYLLFLRISSLRALEHWKACVHLLCHCEAALLDRPRLYARLLRILRAQLALAPRDFFEDELSADNFLRDALANLAELAVGQPLGPQLEAEFGQLWGFLATHFGLTLEALRAGALDEEDEPVVVVYADL